MLILPPEERDKLKAPFGVLYPELSDILPQMDGKIIYAVGDVVTHNLIASGISPEIAVIDGYTMREAYKRTPILLVPRITVRNPPGTITDELVEALRSAVASPPVLIYVEGEEDLAVIPLVIEATSGVFILYGQPGEGVVVIEVDEKARKKAKDMLTLFKRQD